MNFTYYYTSIFFLFIGSLSYSQVEVVTRDFETWTSVSANKSFENNTELELDQGLRMYDNSSSVDQILTNIGLNMFLSDFVTLTPGLRYIADRDKSDGNFEHYLRFSGDLGVKHSVDRFKFKYRLRLQARNELGYSKSEGDFSTRAIRLKAGVSYNIRNWKFDPTVSGEIFRESGKYMLSSFNKYRFSLSTKYKINDLIDLKAYYRLERELGVSYPQTTNIVGFKLIFNL